MRLFSLIALLTPLETQAFEVQTEYRVYGDEVASIFLTEMHEEDPASIVISTVNDVQLRIESDRPLDECENNLTLAKGDATASVLIVVHENAETLNGVVVVQCSLRYR